MPGKCRSKNKTQFVYCLIFIQTGCKAKPHSSVGGIQDSKTGCRWFDPWLGKYYFQGLMIVIATEYIFLSPQSMVSTMIMWESSHRLGTNIVQNTG